MKRILPLWFGLLAFAVTPAMAQQPSVPMGKIHGQVINPTGAPKLPARLQRSRSPAQLPAPASPRKLRTRACSKWIRMAISGAISRPVPTT